MNKYPRFLSIIAAAVFISLCIVGITGIHTEYGDIRSTISSGVTESSTGTGWGDDIMLSFLCPDEKELNDDEVSEICRILEKRISAFGIRDAIVSYDKEMKLFTVEIAYSSRSSYDPNILYDYLGSVGDIQIRAGYEKDDDGHPAGITAETLIADGKDIKKITFSVDDSTSTTRYVCNITYGGETKEKIREYTEKIINAEDSTDKYYSIWIDDKLVTSRAFTEVIKNGVVNSGTIETSSDSTLLNDYTAMQMLAAADRLPFGLTAAYVYNLSDPDHSVRFTGALKLITAALAVAALYFLLRYRLAGIGIILGMVGYCGASSLILSGGMVADLGLYVTGNVIAALASATAAVIITMFFVMNAFSGAMKKSTPFRAAREVFASAEKNGALALVALLLVSVALNLISRFIPAAYSLYELTGVFTLFLAAGYVCVLLGSACFIKSMCSTKKLSNEKLYGGAAA